MIGLLVCQYNLSTTSYIAEKRMPSDHGLNTKSEELIILSMCRKRWQVLQVDSESGRLTYPIIVMDIISSWNKPEFVMPERFLDYGYYMILYTLTMFGKVLMYTTIMLLLYSSHYPNLYNKFNKNRCSGTSDLTYHSQNYLCALPTFVHYMFFV